MRVALHQLRLSEVSAILEQKGSPVGPGDVRSGALPPAFVLRRASAKVLAGEPELWWLPFLILEQDCRAVVGGCAFKGAPINGRVEVLYGVSKTERGRGIASAAVGELVAVAFANGAAEVLAEVEPHNLGSTGVLRRCGFTRLGDRKADDGVEVEQWVLARN
jgi:[ribosomal protein S5]-alanine N-acetyltransferase